MPQQPSIKTWVVIALLAASLLVQLKDLVNLSALPLQALAWTAFAALAYIVLIPPSWRGQGWAFLAAAVMAALSILITSLNPVDPFYLTHWDNPLESLLVALEGYALPLPLMFFAYGGYRDRRRAG